MKKQLLTLTGLLFISIAMAQIKLHPSLSADRTIENYKISPDGNTVVYIADRDADDVFELYSVSILGGTNTKLNGALVVDGDVSFDNLRLFQISANSQTVVYAADQETDGIPELYSVPINGGAVTKLNGSIAGSQGVGSFQLSPDGQTVVYTADELDRFDIELFSVPIGGGASVKLSQPDLGIGDVNRIFHISPDGQWVVYVADADTSSTDEVYSVPINGGTINKINGTLVNGGDVVFNSVFISEDSQYVVYTADQETRLVRELYSTPIGGGTNVKLNATLNSTNDDVERVFLSPDGQWVVYVAGNFSNQDYELFSVPVIGGGAVKLNGPDIDNDFDGSLRNSVTISPDSEVVMYTVNTTNFSTQVIEAFVAPIDGSEASVNISPWVTGIANKKGSNRSNPSAGIIRVSFERQLLSDELRVVYLADGESPGRFSLFTLEFSIFDLFGSGRKNNEATVLNSDLVAGGDVTDFEFTSDGKNVLYRADQEINDVFELYTVPSNGSESAQKLNGSLIPDGDISFNRSTSNSSRFPGVQMNSDGSQLIYMADQEINSVFEMYTVDYSSVLSTEILDLNTIDLYNDQRGNLYIKGIDQKASIEIISILGSKVFATSFDGSRGNSIEIPKIKNGLYLVRLSTGRGQILTKKMIFTH